MYHLHVFHGARNNLLAELDNSLLQQLPYPLTGVFQRVYLLSQLLHHAGAQRILVLFLEIVVHILHHLHCHVWQDVDEINVLYKVLKENINVPLDGLLHPLTVHRNDERVEVGEGEKQDCRGDGDPLHLVPQGEDPPLVHHQSLWQCVVLVPLQEFGKRVVEDSLAQQFLVLGVIELLIGGVVPGQPLSGAHQAVLLSLSRVQELSEFELLVLNTLGHDHRSHLLDGEVGHVQLHLLQQVHDALEQRHHLGLFLQLGQTLVPDRSTEHAHQTKDVTGIFLKLKAIVVNLLLDDFNVKNPLDLLLQLLMLKKSIIILSSGLQAKSNLQFSKII